MAIAWDVAPHTAWEKVHYRGDILAIDTDVNSSLATKEWDHALGLEFLEVLVNYRSSSSILI